jgi:very-short-patch-repair endonuclease
MCYHLKKTGHTFNRQRPILNFIVDFMCKELKLIIEVDGISHFTEETILKDEIKQKALEDAGYTVIRFRDPEILSQIDRVRLAIVNCISQIEERTILPLPPPEGEIS